MNPPLTESQRPRWKATKHSEMRLLMSRLLGGLRAAGFTEAQQVDACINLGRTFGVDIPFLKSYLEKNVGDAARRHPFFERVWEPRYQVGERVRAVAETGPCEGLIAEVRDPSELGAAGVDRPFLYLIDQGEEQVQVWEYQIHSPPRP